MNKFLASSSALLKWLQSNFSYPSSEMGASIEFTLEKGELMIDSDGTSSLYVDSPYNIEFTMSFNKIHRVISVLKSIEDQPIVIFADTDHFCIQSISI